MSENQDAIKAAQDIFSTSKENLREPTNTFGFGREYQSGSKEIIEDPTTGNKTEWAYLSNPTNNLNEPRMFLNERRVDSTTGTKMRHILSARKNPSAYLEAELRLLPPDLPYTNLRISDSPSEDVSVALNLGIHGFDRERVKRWEEDRKPSEIIFEINYSAGDEDYQVKAKYSKSDKSNVQEFFVKKTSDTFSIEGQLFRGWREMVRYLSQRTIRANASDVCRIVNTQGQEATPELGKTIREVYGSAYFGVQAEREGAAGDVEDKEVAKDALWSEDKIDGFLGGVQTKARDYLLPMLSEYETSYPQEVVERVIKIIALEAAPFYARDLDNAKDETAKEKLFKRELTRATKELLERYYHQIQQSEKIAVKCKPILDSGNDVADRFELAFFPGDAEADTNPIAKPIQSVEVQSGDNYDYEGNRYTVSRSGNNILFHQEGAPTISFPGFNVPMEGILEYAQFPGTSGWEKSLDLLPVRVA